MWISRRDLELKNSRISELTAEILAAQKEPKKLRVFTVSFRDPLEENQHVNAYSVSIPGQYFSHFTGQRVSRHYTFFGEHGITAAFLENDVFSVIEECDAVPEVKP